MIHIDWLSVSQQHDDAPEWGAIRRVDFDHQTGEMIVDRLLSDTVQASWDTSLRIRSMGGHIEVSGNPSKWGRLDALTGYTDVASCIEVYNRVLVELGLPPFTAGERIRLATDGNARYTGATISRIDLTRNLIVGAAGVQPFLNWIEAQTWGARLPFRRIGENTVGAGKRNRRQRVFYAKGLELLANLDKWKRSRAFEREQALFYLQRLAHWAQSIGIVRDELRLGTKFFSGSPYRLASSWTPETVIELFEQQSEIQTLEAGAMTDYQSGIYDVLIAKGYSKQMAGLLQSKVHSWMNGDSWHLGLTVPTRYRYQRILRIECGLDLRKPSNIRSLSVCVKPKVLEAKALTREDLPEWYQLPSNVIRLAA